MEAKPVTDPPANKVLVTGASGMVGGEIALELHRAGYEVTAMVRPDSDRAHLADGGIRILEGDITEPTSVLEAMHGQDFVCHAAALVPGTGASEAMYRKVNVDGTRNVCESAVETGVKRLLHVSTVHTFGIHPGDTVDESTRPSGPHHSGYDASKAEAEATVLEYARSKLDAVIVNPATVFGLRSRHSGRLISMFLRGRLYILPLPGRQLSLVHSEDVGLGCRLALEKGRTGERYILSNPAVTVREFINALGVASGRRPPRLILPDWLVVLLVRAMWAASPITRWKPPVTVQGVRGGGTLYDGSKATRELGMIYRPLDETLPSLIACLS